MSGDRSCIIECLYSCVYKSYTNSIIMIIQKDQLMECYANYSGMNSRFINASEYKILYIVKGRIKDFCFDLKTKKINNLIILKSF